MGYFNHQHIPWKYLESTGSVDQQFLFFLFRIASFTQRVLEPTRGDNVLCIVSAGMKGSEQCGIEGSKVNKIIMLIRRSITYKDKKLIIQLYKAIVRPHLEYCVQA